MLDNSQITLSVFFPAYYDEENIGKVVDKAVAVLESLALKDYEIIIIEDGSPDRTGEVADELARKYSRVRVIHHEKNMGYGATLRDGFYAAKFDYVFYSDGDNQFDLDELRKFVALIPYSDIIVGYRISKQYSQWRRFTSFVITTSCAVFSTSITWMSIALSNSSKLTFSKRLKLSPKMLLSMPRLCSKRDF
jgi:glycosyltransferase involved in cell wall biosynthesis